MMQLISKLLILSIGAGFWTLFGSGQQAVFANYTDLVVISPSSTIITHDTTPDIVVKAPSGATVIISEGDTVVGTGNASGNDPVTITLSTLSKGVHSLTAKATYAGIVISSNIPVIFVDDSEPFDIQDVVGITAQLKDHPWDFEADSGEVAVTSSDMSVDALIKRNINFLLRGIEIRAALETPIAAVTVASGTVGGTTNISSAYSSARTFYKVSASPLPVPKLGSFIPSGVVDYYAGDNIFGVDAVTNKYIGYYETDEQGKVVRFALITLTPDKIARSVIKGVVRDDAGMGAANISISFREGSDNRTGDIAATATSTSGGSYEVELKTGVYTAQLNGTGYVTTYLTRNLVDGLDSNNDLVVTGIPQGEETRLVLTWGITPRDLDSHLIGPAPDGSSFHIYYGNQNFTVGSVVYAKLDTDQTTGQGPETTTTATVLQQVYGTYTFYTNNYSNETDLSQSSAKVEVFKGSSTSPLITYSVPTTGSGQRYWNVFDMVIDPVTGITFNEKNILETNVPTYNAPPITPTSIGSISGPAIDGEVTVNLANNAMTGLTTNDFTVTAKVYNVTTNVYSYPDLSNFTYDASTRTISFYPDLITAGSQLKDELEVTITVAPSSTSIRLIGEPVETIFFRLPSLVSTLNIQAPSHTRYLLSPMLDI